MHNDDPNQSPQPADSSNDPSPALADLDEIMQKGFAPAVLLVGFLILIAVGEAGYYFYSKKPPISQIQNQQPVTPQITPKPISSQTPQVQSNGSAATLNVQFFPRQKVLDAVEVK